MKDLAREPNHSLLLLGLDDYINQQTAIRNNPNETYCFECGKRIALARNKTNYSNKIEDKQKRISNINKLLIQIEKPDYGFFGYFQTDVHYGVSLVANITNIAAEILSVSLEDFYIVENGRKISSESGLRGCMFENEVLIPNETRQAGRMWYATSFSEFEPFSDDTSAVITIRVNCDPSLLVYKFDFQNNHFELDDFSVTL